jgi:hypothetical protein
MINDLSLYKKGFLTKPWVKYHVPHINHELILYSQAKTMGKYNESIKTINKT